MRRGEVYGGIDAAVTAIFGAIEAGTHAPPTAASQEWDEHVVLALFAAVLAAMLTLGGWGVYRWQRRSRASGSSPAPSVRQDDKPWLSSMSGQDWAPLRPVAYISLYPVDLFLTHLIVPLRTLLIVRTCIVLFHTVLAGLAFTQPIKRHPDAFAVVCFSTSSVNILILTVLTGGTWSPYDEALMGAIFLMATLMLWRARYFAPTAVLCALLYPIALAVSGTLGDTSIWVSHTAVLFVTAIVSATTSFFLERLRRAAYESREQLDRKSQDLEVALQTIQAQQHNVNADLDQARNFQRKLLRPLPSDKEIEFAALYAPADFLGGDFYDVSRMGPNWYRLFMVDVTGHGAQAAMRTMVLQQQLERASKACDTPWALLSTLNDAVIQAFGSMVVNYCALCIDFKQEGAGWMMTGCNAGLPAPTFMQGHALTILSENGTYQGIVPGVDYPHFDRHMGPGDGLLLATDGIVDLLESDQPVWIPDQAHFTSALDQSAQQALKSIENRIPKSPAMLERSDDLTMLVVRIPRDT